jgi:hypothetical protein
MGIDRILTLLIGKSIKLKHSIIIFYIDKIKLIVHQVEKCNN